MIQGWPWVLSHKLDMACVSCFSNCCEIYLTCEDIDSYACLPGLAVSFPQGDHMDPVGTGTKAWCLAVQLMASGAKGLFFPFLCPGLLSTASQLSVSDTHSHHPGSLQTAQIPSPDSRPMRSQSEGVCLWHLYFQNSFQVNQTLARVESNSKSLRLPEAWIHFLLRSEEFCFIACGHKPRSLISAGMGVLSFLDA